MAETVKEKIRRQNKAQGKPAGGPTPTQLEVERRLRLEAEREADKERWLALDAAKFFPYSTELADDDTEGAERRALMDKVLIRVMLDGDAALFHVVAALMVEDPKLTTAMSTVTGWKDANTDEFADRLKLANEVFRGRQIHELRILADGGNATARITLNNAFNDDNFTYGKNGRAKPPEDKTGPGDALRIIAQRAEVELKGLAIDDGP